MYNLTCAMQAAAAKAGRLRHRCGHRVVLPHLWTSLTGERGVTGHTAAASGWGMNFFDSYLACHCHCEDWQESQWSFNVRRHTVIDAQISASRLPPEGCHLKAALADAIPSCHDQLVRVRCHTVTSVHWYTPSKFDPGTSQTAKCALAAARKLASACLLRPCAM